MNNIAHQHYPIHSNLKKVFRNSAKKTPFPHIGLVCFSDKDPTYSVPFCCPVSRPLCCCFCYCQCKTMTLEVELLLPPH